MLHVLHAGTIALSSSRRLSATLRTEQGSASAFVDLRLQIADGTGWKATNQALRFEADRLPELLSVLERALRRLPEV